MLLSPNFKSRLSQSSNHIMQSSRNINNTRYEDMITQETKPIKTWGGFNLVILKVNLNPLSWKNRNSYNKTYKPPHSTSYRYPLVELTNTTTCKLRIHGLLLSWILHQIQAHPLVFSLSFNGSNWNDHQGVEKSFSWKS